MLLTFSTSLSRSNFCRSRSDRSSSVVRSKWSRIESFPFEEMPAPIHTDYLWGNPAFACAYLMAKFQGAERRIGDLPAHGGQPVAEINMSEKDAEFLMNHGIMPLASLKDQDAALLVRFQSLAHPIAALAGNWRE